MIARRKNAGVGLIEILISIVIVSFALLGLAGLLTTGLKSTQSSQHRTQASFFAYDMADRMRTNRQAALDGQYATSVSSTNAIAQTDKQCWLDALAGNATTKACPYLTSALPSGVGTVAMANARAFTITIQWDDSKAVGGSVTQSFVVSGEL